MVSESGISSTRWCRSQESAFGDVDEVRNQLHEMLMKPGISFLRWHWGENVEENWYQGLPKIWVLPWQIREQDVHE